MQAVEDVEAGHAWHVMVNHKTAGPAMPLIRKELEGARIPSILISGRVDAQIKERAARLGVGEIVEKPFAAGRLIELIRTTLAETH